MSEENLIDECTDGFSKSITKVFEEFPIEIFRVFGASIGKTTAGVTGVKGVGGNLNHIVRLTIEF